MRFSSFPEASLVWAPKTKEIWTCLLADCSFYPPKMWSKSALKWSFTFFHEAFWQGEVGISCCGYWLGGLGSACDPWVNRAVLWPVCGPGLGRFCDLASPAFAETRNGVKVPSGVFKICTHCNLGESRGFIARKLPPYHPLLDSCLHFLPWSISFLAKDLFP